MCQEAAGSWLGHFLQGHYWAERGKCAAHMHSYIYVHTYSCYASHRLRVACMKQTFDSVATSSVISDIIKNLFNFEKP